MPSKYFNNVLADAQIIPSLYAEQVWHIKEHGATFLIISLLSIFLYSSTKLRFVGQFIPTNYQNHYTTANQWFVLCLYYFLARSFITSPATISPTTDGTNAVEPGISRRTVHFLAVPGGQMQS